MRKPIVFLSHASHDKQQLIALKALLDKRAVAALDFFLSCDGQSIPFGRNWVMRIGDALSHAKLMFVFLSPQSADSKWLHFEAGSAYDKGVRVVPVCLPGIDLNRVTGPLNLLQGFNLHSHEALANLARICNETFELRIDETFQADDFRGVFAESLYRNGGFFDKYSCAVEKITFHSHVQVPEAEVFDPFPALQKICHSGGVEILTDEQTDKNQQPQTQIDLPGCSITAYQSILNTGKDPSPVKDIHISGALSPELFHLNAPLLDNWFREAAFLQPWHAQIHFGQQIRIETRRHRLTTKLYQSGIRLIDRSRLDFQGLGFEFPQYSGESLSFQSAGNLHDRRWVQLIGRLFDLNVLF